MKGLLLAVLLSFPLFAADEFVVHHQCYTPRVADTGYQLIIETGGIAGITQVKVFENSFAGAKYLGKFIVRVQETGSSTVYTGKDIRVVIGPGEYPAEIGIPSKVYRATFVLKGNDGKKHQGPLNCRSPQDPQ
ncbi:MAG: hypothetical protein EBR01_02840 [Proteobacteria bacterium]|nr:hypothetical protein [Pseudomonadota bacterium]